MDSIHKTNGPTAQRGLSGEMRRIKQGTTASDGGSVTPVVPVVVCGNGVGAAGTGSEAVCGAEVSSSAPQSPPVMEFGPNVKAVPTAAEAAPLEDARVSVKLFGPAFAIEHVIPRKIAGTWHPKEGIPCKPPIEITVICAAATAPRSSVMLGGETLMSKSGDRVTEVQALINALASTEPSPVAISYPEPAL